MIALLSPGNGTSGEGVAVASFFAMADLLSAALLASSLVLAGAAVAALPEASAVEGVIVALGTATGFPGALAVELPAVEPVAEGVVESVTESEAVAGVLDLSSAATSAGAAAAGTAAGLTEAGAGVTGVDAGTMPASCNA